MLKVLLTGSEGFLGKAVQERLKDAAFVYRYDRSLGHNILDQHDLYNYMVNSDLVIHLAAETGIERSWLDPNFFYENNVLGSAKVFKAAREMNKKVIYASTGEVHVSNNPYAASKAGAESAVKSEQQKGLEIVILRILNPYGPRQPNNYIIPRFFRLALANQPLTIHGTGEQRKDYIYVTDIAEAFWEARKLPAGTIGDLGMGETHSIKEIAEAIVKLTGSKSEIIYVPSPRVGEKPATEGNMEQLYSLGWKPLVSFIEGLRKVANVLQVWYDG